jgi:tRNA nucleotidyltransferase (CCA-adding enzyme)
VGRHQWRFIDQTARAQAPLALRFAALMHKAGRAGSAVGPRAAAPSPRLPGQPVPHQQRAHAAIAALARCAAVPAEAQALAHLAVDECERIHRVHDLRAGTIAALLERLQAREDATRLEQLLLLCRCDWAAFEGHDDDAYPEAERMRLALAASRGADVGGLDAAAALQARAEAIAAALGSGVRR